MKRIAVLLILFGAGFLVASFALADDGGTGRDSSYSVERRVRIP